MLVNIFQDIDREDLERGINLMKLSSVEGLPKCIRVSVSSMSYLLFTIALLELCYHGLFYIGGKRVKSMWEEFTWKVKKNMTKLFSYWIFQDTFNLCIPLFKQLSYYLSFVEKQTIVLFLSVLLLLNVLISCLAAEEIFGDERGCTSLFSNNKRWAGWKPIVQN